MVYNIMMIYLCIIKQTLIYLILINTILLGIGTLVLIKRVSQNLERSVDLSSFEEALGFIEDRFFFLTQSFSRCGPDIIDF